MEKIGIKFKTNNDKYVTPTRYIGADVEKFQLPYNKEAWILTSNYYLKDTVDKVKDLLNE